jgi:hypothetical protein
MEEGRERVSVVESERQGTDRDPVFEKPKNRDIHNISSPSRDEDVKSN